jgi:hypothetical protein
MPFEKTIFRVHAIKRIFERNFLFEEVKIILSKGKVIENYPKDKPFPSYLVLGYTKDARAVHIVAADDQANKTTVIITVYEPDPHHWEDKFERRRK